LPKEKGGSQKSNRKSTQKEEGGKIEDGRWPITAELKETP